MQRYYFIGIKIPPHVVELAEMFKVQYRLSEHYKVIPHPSDLHVTLLFLGGVADEHLPSLKDKLAEIARDATPFSLHINGLSYFGSKSGPRVVYLSVMDCEELNKIHQDINTAIPELLSVPRSDRFVPHVTIAKKRRTTEKIEIDKQKVEPIKVFVDSFSLFTIHPNKSPKYEATEIYKFGK